MSDTIDLQIIVNNDYDPSSFLLTIFHYYDIDELINCNSFLQENNFNILILNVQSLNGKIDEIFIFLNTLQKQIRLYSTTLRSKSHG